MQTKTLWIGTQPDPDDRLKVRVSQVDFIVATNLENHTGRTQITDLDTGKILTVKRGDCGLGCLCALELAP